MDDLVETEAEGQGEVTQEQAPETTSAEYSQETSTDSTGGDNPAWAPFRDALGEVGYHSVKPHLQQWDKTANERISAVNAKYEPWKQFDTDGVSADQLRAAYGLQQQMEQLGAEGLYAQLREALKQQGRLPAEEAAAQQQAEDVDQEELDPRDQQLAELRQQQEQMTQFLQEQEQQRQYEQHRQQYETQIDNDLKSIREKFPEFTDREIGMVLQNAASQHQSTGKEPSLMKLAQEVADYRTSILSTPRPNDTAPRLPGSGGGNVASQPKDAAKYSQQESQDLFAARLRELSGN